MDLDVINLEKGYSDDIFVNCPHSRLHCTICTRVLKNPQQCLNGHLFCFACISAILKQQESCPSCGATVLPSGISVIRDMINDLSVKCNNKDCLWTGPLKSRNKHINEECMLGVVSCKFGCPAVVPRYCQDSHFQECQFRPLLCDFCENSFPRKEFWNHQVTCTERPTHCPNGCGKVIRSSQTIQHREDDCPLQEIVCSHYHKGQCVPSCNGFYQRELANHHNSLRLHACSNINLICSEIIASECLGEVDERIHWIVPSESKDMDKEVSDYGGVRL